MKNQKQVFKKYFKIGVLEFFGQKINTLKDV